MKKISISLIVALLIGGMLLNGCSNGTAQINNVETNSAESTKQETLKSSKLDSKLIELYQSTKEKQKENDERNIFGIDEAKFDKDGKLWVKCVEAGDIYREDQIMIENHVFTIYDSIDKHIQYWKEVGIKMNTEQVVSNNCFKDVVGKPEESTLQEFQTIENEFENMKDYYEELANSSTSSNKTASNTKTNKIETTNKSVNSEHYKYGDVIKVLKAVDIGDYEIANLVPSSNNQYSFVMNDEYKNHFIDKKGNIITNKKWKDFQISSTVNSELAIVRDKEKDKYGIIDREGNYVLNPEYTHIHFQNYGEYFFVSKDNKLFMLGNKFNKLFEYDYHEFKYLEIAGRKLGMNTMFYNNLFNIYDGNKWGYVDINGKTVIDFKYDLAGNFNDYGFSSVVSKNASGEYKYGLIDKNDNIIIDFQYDSALSFGKDGISQANKDGQGYFINLDNNKVLQGLLFEHTNGFSEGLAFVENGNSWGIIDRNGSEVLPCIFSSNNAKTASIGYNYRFRNGLACVLYKNKLLLITYLEPSAFGYTYDDVNNAYRELADISGDGNLWNNLSANLLDKIEKNNWTEDDYKNDLNHTLTYKSIQPDSWYVTGAGVWYYFENDRTTTKKGWFVDSRDEQTYYLDTNTGRMAVGWTEIDGEMYYFNESHDNEPNWYEIGNGFYESYGKKVKAYGSMFRDETTPDGKRVDSDGKLIK